MVVPGVWLLFESPRLLFLSGRESALLGAVSIAVGNFVFMVMVADRLFPSVTRRQVAWTIEMMTLLIGAILLILIGARFV
jgi:hypothetical protein